MQSIVIQIIRNYSISLLCVVVFTLVIRRNTLNLLRFTNIKCINLASLKHELSPILTRNSTPRVLNYNEEADEFGNCEGWSVVNVSGQRNSGAIVFEIINNILT